MDLASISRVSRRLVANRRELDSTPLGRSAQKPPGGTEGPWAEKDLIGFNPSKGARPSGGKSGGKGHASTISLNRVFIIAVKEVY